MTLQASKQAQPEMAALFVSDLHLQEDMPHTMQAFLTFLQEQAPRAAQLYLLGDIFEAWVGDDDISDPCHRRIADAIRHLSEQGTAVFWMAGNRDFLVGERFAQDAGMTLLADPFVTTIASRSLVLTHGDAWCTDDTAYMEFRAQVRQPEWQQHFLSLPLAQRKKIAGDLRAGSREAQKGKSYAITDVNEQAITDLFDRTAATDMIHGHTHRPALHRHQIGDTTHLRYVLSDWDLDHGAPRGDWLSIDHNGTIRRHDLHGEEVETGSKTG
ncbi:MAG TPA: UDP-2,3-diacylglucosamine diphosphatase [Oxalicibacterium sp.]|nr:UDP-2,3-diacylglucosamine diphosphatase [Oxalicibacterium sp.]